MTTQSKVALDWLREDNPRRSLALWNKQLIDLEEKYLLLLRGWLPTEQSLCVICKHWVFKRGSWGPSGKELDCAVGAPKWEVGTDFIDKCGKFYPVRHWKLKLCRFLIADLYEVVDGLNLAVTREEWIT